MKFPVDFSNTHLCDRMKSTIDILEAEAAFSLGVVAALDPEALRSSVARLLDFCCYVCG